MPVCCILQCGSRKNKNQPQLTHHRFPKNERLRRKWLAAVSEENINPRHKEWYLCSFHFEEACFNRTLDVTRLRDNSVPSIFPTSAKKSIVLREEGNVMTDVASMSSSSLLLHTQRLNSMKKLQKEVVVNQKINILKEKSTQHKKTIKSLKEKLRRKNKKLAELKDIIEDIRQKNI